MDHDLLSIEIKGWQRCKKVGLVYIICTSIVVFTIYVVEEVNSIFGFLRTSTAIFQITD